MFYDVSQVFHDVLLCFMMFSESRNDRRPLIASGIATTRKGSAITPQKSVITPQKSAMAPQDRLYRRERDPMLNSILNGDWSNFVSGSKIPEGQCSGIFLSIA